VTATTTARRVRYLLADLGDSPDAVAETLRAAGITGVREVGSACPVANWLHHQEPTLGDLEVSEEEVALLLSDDDEPGDHFEWVIQTDAVADFIVRFDHGHYPDLVAGGAS